MWSPFQIYDMTSDSHLLPNDYQDCWQRYKKLRNLFWIVWLGYVPVVGMLSVLVLWFFGTFVPGFVFAGLWMLMFLVVHIRLSGWPCPRCGKPFSKKWWYDKGFFARKCVHCGLAKYAAYDRGPGPASS